MRKLKQHPINRYCDQEEMSHADFAEFIGVTRQYVWQMTDSGDVGRKTAKIIVDKTGGDISYDDIYSWKPPTRRIG